MSRQVSRQPPIRVYSSAFRAMPAFFVAIPPLPLNCGEMRSAGGTLWVDGGSQKRRGSEQDGIGGVLLPLFPQGVHFVQSLHRWILWTLWRFYRGGGCFQVAVPGVGQVGTCVDVLEAAGGYLGRRSLSQPNRGASGGDKCLGAGFRRAPCRKNSGPGGFCVCRWAKGPVFGHGFSIGLTVVAV